MKVKKIIYRGILVIIIVIVSLLIGLKNYYSKDNVICESISNDIIVNKIQEIKEEMIIEDNDIENIIEKNEIIEEVDYVQEEKNISKDTKEEKKVEVKASEQKKDKVESVQTVSTPVVESKTEITINKETPIVQETISEIPTVVDVTQPVKEITTEEYRFNNEMTQNIINIINSNPSEYMIQDGYTVEVDSSIVNLTNQFTFTEERVKNKVLYKAGTIKVYAQDYYFGGQYLFTECYIM